MLKGKTGNLLKPRGARQRKIFWKRKYVYVPVIVGTLLVVLAAILALIYKTPAERVYQQSLAGKNSFMEAQKLLADQKFNEALPVLLQTEEYFTSARTEFSKFSWVGAIPWLGTQVKSLDHLLEAAINTAAAARTLDELAIKIVVPLTGEDVTLSSISDEQTAALLSAIYQAKPDLESAQTSVDLALEEIKSIPKHGVYSKIRELVDLFEEKVVPLQVGLKQGISASQIVPVVAGYPEEKTYLFLLQNNSELRPSGGFIGTYGILKVKDGDIKYFQTENSYNLDLPAAAWLKETPPWPLTRYNAVRQWFFRDANWSPDFPTTARETEKFYHLERGPEENIDGVIAVTPSFIQSLMTLTGEIPVDGITFTADNFIETLQYQVEQGYLRQGIADSERKEIIGVLSSKLIDALLDLPQSKWPDLWDVFTRDISEKQILLYLKDEYIQSLILQENWGGQIQPTQGDYLAVIDANLASLKTDPMVERHLDYTVQRDGKHVVADLKITYTNTGSITWKTTRYRTYTRVYVPAGALLLKAEGMMLDCKIDEEGNVEKGEELGKTVFGVFICIEPGETKTLSIKYTLPREIYNQFYETNTYQLLFQKQAGAKNHNFTVQIDMAKRAAFVDSVDNFSITDHNAILLKGDLSFDRKIKIGY